MKILIYLACMTVYAVIMALLNYAGVMLGGIPTAILAAVTVFVPAPALCKVWDNHKKSKMTDETTKNS